MNKHIKQLDTNTRVEQQQSTIYEKSRVCVDVVVVMLMSLFHKYTPCGGIPFGAVNSGNGEFRSSDTVH